MLTHANFPTYAMADPRCGGLIRLRKWEAYSVPQTLSWFPEGPLCDGERGQERSEMVNGA